MNAWNTSQATPDPTEVVVELERLPDADPHTKDLAVSTAVATHRRSTPVPGTTPSEPSDAEQAKSELKVAESDWKAPPPKPEAPPRVQKFVRAPAGPDKSPGESEYISSADRDTELAPARTAITSAESSVAASDTAASKGKNATAPIEGFPDAPPAQMATANSPASSTPTAADPKSGPPRRAPPPLEPQHRPALSRSRSATVALATAADGSWRPSVVRVAWANPVEPSAPSSSAPKPKSNSELRREMMVVLDPEGSPSEGPAAAEGQPSPNTEGEPSPNTEMVPEPADVVADLREALGWKPIDRENLPQHRPGQTGSLSSLPSSGSSPSVLDPEIPIADRVELSATGTPLGAYTDEIYKILYEAWQREDLTPHERALGIQGQVTVAFRVHRQGQVTDTQVHRASGHDRLDKLALQAVPGRLPPIPSEVDSQTILQYVTFTYRNPLIAREYP